MHPDSETGGSGDSTEEISEGSLHEPGDLEAGDDASPDSQDDFEPDEDGTNDDIPVPPRHPRRPTKPKLIERYAKARGFTKDNIEGRYYHDEDGSWIERVSGKSFPWELYSASGELLQCYWIKDHCLEREPLQLGADVWELCIKHPEKYTLLLTDPDGMPVEYSGKQIRELQENGRLTLFPANYRLVLDYDKDEGDLQ